MPIDNWKKYKDRLDERMDEAEKIAKGGTEFVIGVGKDVDHRAKTIIKKAQEASGTSTESSDSNEGQSSENKG